jgi:hypothetical protein
MLNKYFSIMKFQEESVDLTKEIIEKAIHTLLDIIPKISTRKTFKNKLKIKIFFNMK